MEFKGTKGKWEVCSGTSLLAVKIGDKFFGIDNSYKESKANALLISKTPELLELHQSELKTLLNLQQTMYDKEVSISIIQEIERMIFYKEKLIKQATEL